VEQGQQAKLVWGKELYFDATQIEANADLDSFAPRFAVEAREAIREHLAALFTSEAPASEEAEGNDRDASGLEALLPPEETSPEPTLLPTPLSETLREELAAENATGHHWIAEEGRPQRACSWELSADGGPADEHD
jgi:hypothetical protein